MCVLSQCCADVSESQPQPICQRCRNMNASAAYAPIIICAQEPSWCTVTAPNRQSYPIPQLCALHIRQAAACSATSSLGSGSAKGGSRARNRGEERRKRQTVCDLDRWAGLATLEEPARAQEEHTMSPAGSVSGLPVSGRRGETSSHRSRRHVWDWNELEDDCGDQSLLGT